MTKYRLTKFLLLISTFLCIAVSFSSCLNKYEEQTPIYEKITVSDKTPKSNQIELTHNLQRLSNYSELKEKIQNIVTLDVPKDTSTTYSILPGEVFTVEIHISNPRKYEIQSFTLNGEKYANYMFKEGSTMELLLLDVTAPEDPGYFELTVDAIKYIDGTDIKDVKMNGDRTIQLGVIYTVEPSATVSAVSIGTTTASFTVDVSDEQNVIGEAPINFYLSDGKTIVFEQALQVGTNTVSVTDLAIKSKYEYGIATYYDFIDGQGTLERWMYISEFETNSAYTIAQSSIGKDNITFSIQKICEEGSITSIVLKDIKTDSVVAALDNTSSYRFDRLLSDHNYKITVNFSYKSGQEILNDSCSLLFKTKNKSVPTVSLTQQNVTQTSISFNLQQTDADNILNIEKVSLYRGTELIEETVDTSVREFKNLLSDNNYTIKVSYSYDLNDGSGKQNKVSSFTKKTVSKTTPTISLIHRTPMYDTIDFDAVITDSDNILNIEKIELYSGVVLVKTAENTNLREFTELSENNEYVVKISYSYDLNDGNGIRKNNVEKKCMTSLSGALLSGYCGDNVMWNIIPNSDNMSFYTLALEGSGAMYSYSSSNRPDWYEHKNNFMSLTVGDKITNIGSYAFDGFEKLKTATVGANIQSIGAFAFRQCYELEEMAIPDNVKTIEERAFEDCRNIKKLTIGKNVSTIKDNAFAYCWDVESIVMPDSVLNIGSSAFSTCNDLIIYTNNSIRPNGWKFTDAHLVLNFKEFYTESPLIYALRNDGTAILIGHTSGFDDELIIPDTVNGYKVTGIGTNAFNGTILDTVVVGSNVTDIYEKAFAYCGNFNILVIPNSVINIDNLALFNSTPDIILASVAAKPNGWKCNFSDSSSVIWNFQSIYTDTQGVKYALLNDETAIVLSVRKDVISIVVPETVDGHKVICIFENAFYSCTTLENLVIGSNVTNIGNNAFSGCRALRSIVIPINVTDIGSDIFAYCSVDTLVVYAEASAKPLGWASNWNKNDRITVIWGYQGV